MRKIIVLLVVFLIIGTQWSSAQSQAKTPDPFILSIMPDSLFAKYEYSQIVFVSVSIPTTFGKDPTVVAINDLKKQIVALCQLNKFDGFILNQWAPSAAGAHGTLGTFAWDASNFYICVATNSWKKIGIAW